MLLIIIAIRNVCRIIIWKDLNWKMCKKNPYNCVHGFRPENNRFLIDCNVQSNTAIIVKHWHKWIDIHNTKWNLYIHTLYHAIVVAQVIQLSVSGSWEPLVIMRMFVWSSEVSYSYINSTPFFRLKIVSTNVKSVKNIFAWFVSISVHLCLK
jgi:hypothetical protein